MTRSVGGNTGSGMGVIIQEALAEYGKCIKADLRVYPDFTSLSQQATLNSLLSTYHGLNFDSTMSLCMDRGSLKQYNINNLEINNPSNDDSNELAAYILASITSPMRHGGSINGSIGEMSKSLIPFPRLSNLIPSVAPLYSENKSKKVSMSTQELTNSIFLTDKQLFNYGDKSTEDRFVASYLSYQGRDFSLTDIDKAIQSLESKLSFADFSSARFKVCLNFNPPFSTKKIFNSGKSIAALHNTTRIANGFMKLSEHFKTFADKYSDNQSVIEAVEEVGYLIEENQTYSKPYEVFDGFEELE